MIRKLRPLEKFYEVAQRHGVLMVGYQATLRTKQKLKEEDLRQVAHLLYRKIPTFRSCFKEKDGEFYLAEMEQEIIDFEVKEGATDQEVMQEISHTPFDSSKGPLWRMRYVPPSEDASPSSELSTAFPFESNVFFGFSHANTDGFCNMKILELFVRVLDDVLANRPIDDEQFGVRNNWQNTEKIQTQRRKEFEEDPEMFEKVKEEIRNAYLGYDTLWNDSFGVNSMKCSEKKTFHAAFEFSEDVTQKLKDKFKAYGVSLNSMVCALGNVMLVEMMRERGLEQDVFNIGSYQGINLRQYWPKDSLDDRIHFGMDSRMMKLHFETSTEDVKNFWQYAQRVHKKIQEKVKAKWTFSEDIVQELLIPNDIESIHQLLSQEDPSHTFLFTTSSLGNMDRAVTFSRENVQWTSIGRTTSMHLLSSPLSYYFQFFRGKLSVSFEYTNYHMSHEVAKTLMSEFQRKLKEVVSFP